MPSFFPFAEDKRAQNAADHTAVNGDTAVPDRDAVYEVVPRLDGEISVFLIVCKNVNNTRENYAQRNYPQEKFQRIVGRNAFLFCHENKNDKPQHHRARDDKPIPPYFKIPDAERHGIYIHKNVV